MSPNLQRVLSFLLCILNVAPFFVRHTDQHMTAPSLTIQDLKARGWSKTMIRTLLGTHDQEQMSNKLGKRMDKPGLQIQPARVVELEATDAFVQAQERARAHARGMVKAKQSRQAWEAELVARYEALPLPGVEVRLLPVGVRPSTDPTVWQFHLDRFARWHTQHESVVARVPAAARRAAQQRMLQRYREAVDQASGWVECREPQCQCLSASMEDTG
ncbi:hypothetical protein ACFFLM_00670 [Deinococcus oregonensis]|uniref:Uncharacterized protein n=1 Tax=Deinococcus oregonensis TaxID=1805970 RepID=A0ABV6AU29_9DEIO